MKLPVFTMKEAETENKYDMIIVETVSFVTTKNYLIFKKYSFFTSITFFDKKRDLPSFFAFRPSV